MNDDNPDSSAQEKRFKKEEHLKLLLEASGESANRCRLVTMFLVVATILSFMAFWNSVDYSWVRTRQKKLAQAVDLWNRAGDTNAAKEFQGSKALVETKLFWKSGW